MFCWQCLKDSDIGEVDGLGRFSCVACESKKAKGNVTLSAIVPSKSKSPEEVVITAPIGEAMKKLGWMPPTEVAALVEECANLRKEINDLRDPMNRKIESGKVDRKAKRK